MTKSDKEFILEVKRVRSETDPSIPLFLATFSEEGREGGIWPETFGSKEQLDAFLRGLEISLRMLGYPTHLHWHIPDTWHEPRGVRWRIKKNELSSPEEINSSGEVLQV